MENLVREIPRDENEHALKWVINSITRLCNEFAALEGKDPNEYMHLELSTAQIIGELQMPAIEHAKHEVLLLTNLYESLSQLICVSANVLESLEVVERLTSFRNELRQLLVKSMRTMGVRQKSAVSFSRDDGGSPERKSEKRSTTNPVAERTKTPSDEARRQGHDKDRSDRVTEMSEGALRKLRQKIGGPTQEIPKAEPDSDSDTKATRSAEHEHASSRGVVDDRSRRIWLEEELDVPPANVPDGRPIADSRSTAANRREKTEPGDTDAIVTPTPPARFGFGMEQWLNLLGVENEPPIAKDELQTPPLPFLMTERILPKIMHAEIAVQKRDQADSNCWIITSCVAVLAVATLLLWISPAARYDAASGGCNARRPFLFLWQMVCGVCNVFCENYGTFCTNYCTSGLQRDKWLCRR